MLIKNFFFSDGFSVVWFFLFGDVVFGQVEFLLGCVVGRFLFGSQENILGIPRICHNAFLARVC